MRYKTVAAATLGCKVNFYETEAMLELFSKCGYEIRNFSDTADVYIINTCTVTNHGDKKSRQMIRRAVLKNPNAIIAAVGCYPQADPDSVAAIDGVDIIIGTKNRVDIVNIIENHSKDKKADYVSKYSGDAPFEPLRINALKGRTRVFLKVQDGCDRYCSYCIIPYVRGPVRSRPLDSIKSEAGHIAENDYKEIVLSGIHICSYGKDIGLSLIDAIKTVADVKGIERVRLSSLEPTIITQEFVSELSGTGKICDHFHLSLQSGCKKTLMAMNRRYTPDEYLKALKLIRAEFPDAAITTDIIVGFPGETDKDFEETYRFCEEAKLAKIHVFPYSPKKGTRASEMPGQLPEHIKSERTKTLIQLSRKLSDRFAARFYGSVKPVLFEREAGLGEYHGHTTNYLPIAVKSGESLINKIIDVKLDKANILSGIFGK